MAPDSARLGAHQGDLGPRGGEHEGLGLRVLEQLAVQRPRLAEVFRRDRRLRCRAQRVQLRSQPTVSGLNSAECFSPAELMAEKMAVVGGRTCDTSASSSSSARLPFGSRSRAASVCFSRPSGSRIVKYSSSAS